MLGVHDTFARLGIWDHDIGNYRGNTLKHRLRGILLYPTILYYTGPEMGVRSAEHHWMGAGWRKAYCILDHIHKGSGANLIRTLRSQPRGLLRTIELCEGTFCDYLLALGKTHEAYELRSKLLIYGLVAHDLWILYDSYIVPFYGVSTLTQVPLRRHT